VMVSLENPPVRSWLQGKLSRMRYPHLFLLLLVLFGVDMIVPDLVPMVDELILAVLTMLVGTWRRSGEDAPPPPSQPPPALPGR
jgi:hypothetical protein